MKRRELNVLFLKSLRGEATPAEAERVNALRAGSAEAEAAFDGISKTLGDLTAISNEDAAPPGSPFEDAVMRKIRVEAESTKGIRGLMRELKKNGSTILGLAALVTAFFIPIGPRVQQQQRYFTNRIRVAPDAVAAGPGGGGAGVSQDPLALTLIILCGIIGIALLAIGSSGRTRNSKGLMALGFGFVVVAARMLVFDLIFSDMVNPVVME